MNKYLLLRDNKQSGPYTVPEIIDKGIKPYDLVWLEGKSAAWRYPSEVEELKAYAPVVEEQPFDRFYKKPETVVQEAEEQISSFESKTVAPKPTPAIILQHSASSKKVYVNFPGAAKKQDRPAFVPDYSIENRSADNQKTEESIPVPARSTFGAVAEMESSPEPALTSMSPRKSPDSKILYGVIAACFILVMLVSILIINYNSQRNNINNLHAIVQQMEQREKQDQPVVQTSLAQNTTPPVTIEPVSENERSLNGIASGSIADNKPVKKVNRTVPAAVIPAVNNSKKSASDSRNTPANTPAVEESSVAAAKTATTENLFRLVSVKSNKFKTGLLGGISNLQMELTNNSQQELHKVAVEIKYFGPEKKLVRTQTVYFENVSPGGQLTVDVPKSNRGVFIDYTITDIKS